MSTKYFVDLEGKYLGGFVGAEPPEGAIEVVGPPEYGTQKWDGSKWVGDLPAKTLPKRDFMKLFTDNERRQISGAAMQNVDVSLWKDGLLLADDIRLDHPDLLSGMDAIVAAGLLTESRKNAILAGEAPT
ncbi:hypothetical protein [Kiloniella majae]|uniref:hypothetical protein n=1 Tax=Kiloniella majae TaxID=1938558 RepID=UPI000A2782F3|nr:hypothetical protein [Kiloniella majae]